MSGKGEWGKSLRGGTDGDCDDAPGEITPLVVDLSGDDDAVIAGIEPALPIDLLVNNAGKLRGGMGMLVLSA